MDARGDGKSGDRSRVVLLVDDHSDTREMYVEYLSSAGLTTLEATCCADALAAVTANVIDVIVLDRRLPDGDGAEIVASLRGAAQTRTVPIVVLSGREDDGSIAADAYLLKPVMPDALHGEIVRLVRDGPA